MATSYLLPCSCGQKVRVEVGQAGGSARCTCGAQLDVPAMRQIRDLEEAPSDDRRPDAPADSWSPRKGAILLGLVIAAVSAGAGVYQWATQPVPVVNDLETSLATIADQTATLSPAATWNLWRYYILERGLVAQPNPHAMPIATMLAADRRQSYRVVLVIGGLGLCLSVLAFVWKPRGTSVG